MSLQLADCTFSGPALPEPFVKFDLEGILVKLVLLPKAAGAEGKALQERWEDFRDRLRKLGDQGGSLRVRHHVIEPLARILGYSEALAEPEVETREGFEDGGFLLKSPSAAALRTWTVEVGTDLDAPSRRGRAYRFSPDRVAQRVLLAKGERVGLLTDGQELRVLICDPARPDSHIAVRLDRGRGGWRGVRELPDSFRLVLALASPAGVPRVSDITEAARLAQSRVTARLREQARKAIEGFIQEVLDHPGNGGIPTDAAERDKLARDLWREGLIFVYRLLFVFKLEASADPARAFSFASSSLWRNTFSPSTALARHARAHLDDGAETGRMLEDGLRVLFRLFSDGISSSELHVSPLGGMLFGENSTPLLDSMQWGERAVTLLLDRLLWTPGGRAERERVHYGALDVEDLGRVYEALLELEPGIAGEPMCRLRRQKLEVVVPVAQGERYRAEEAATAANGATAGGEDEENDAKDEDDGPEEVAPGRAKKTRVLWIGGIAQGRFYLRVGLGRKASGSYYTPHAFVRFLIQETLGPQVAERSPAGDPKPAALLGLKVLDPAMGSGHFLVEACRFLGEKLYEACRLCDELAATAEAEAGQAKQSDERRRLLAQAAELRKRVEDLPDPNDELVAYLPSRVAEGEETGLSQMKALAISRRLVAVHCLYGVDKNPLAVELAKLSLWLESYAEGLPLTFLDHRLVCGDSLTGPFFEHLRTYPGSGESIEGLFVQGLTDRLTATLQDALAHVRALEETVGKDVADVEHKRAAKERLDAALAPFKLLAAAWSGGVMLGGDECDDDAYETLLRSVAERTDAGAVVAGAPGLGRMVEAGREGVPFELAFPEVLHLGGDAESAAGFHAVVGNPPWDALQPLAKEFFAAFDLRVLDAPTRRERAALEQRVTSDPAAAAAFKAYAGGFESTKRLIERAYGHVNRQARGAPSGAVSDVWQGFAERGMRLLRESGCVGWVLPSAFHSSQSGTGIRDLYLNRAALRCCYSFENRLKLFEIDSRFKFAAIVAARDAGGTSSFSCAFYLHDLEWLFRRDGALTFTREFVQRTGGDYLSFSELRSEADVQVAAACFANGVKFEVACDRLGIRLGRELHMTDDANRFSSADGIAGSGSDAREPSVSKRLRDSGYLPLHEGKTFHQFDDRWGDPPRYLVHLSRLADKPTWLRPAAFYRLAFRDIARSTDERTGIFCLMPPGVVCGNKAPCERAPAGRPVPAALLLLAIADSFPFDFTLRLRVQATVNLFILNGCPLPTTLFAPATVGRPAPSFVGEQPSAAFLVHSALRLSCNHAGYETLWHEQVGDEWRESTPRFSWPVLDGEDDRWAARAAIDAVVAEAYGLTREQYAHVLTTFSHKSYPTAPQRCLAAFDGLKQIGLDAFVRQHDPYHDVPLSHALPKPALDLPVPAGAPLPRKRGARYPAAHEEQLGLAVMAADGDRGDEPSDPAGGGGAPAQKAAPGLRGGKRRR